MSRQVPDGEDCPTAGGMPMLGLGTWENTDPEQCAESVRTALEAGYRHVDTAQAYGNEAAVGEGIARADVPREELFLATKVWIDRLDRQGVLDSTRRSLDDLGVDSVDLLYVHWPARTYDPVETLDALNELHEAGLVDRIGVSNFTPEQVDEAVEHSAAPVFANQVECHPLLPQEELRAHCADRGVEVVAYSPLARGELLGNPELVAVAEARGAAPAQVALAWLREKGVAAIPKATGAEHVRENWASLAVELSPADVERIDALDRTARQVDPEWAPWR